MAPKKRAPNKRRKKSESTETDEQTKAKNGHEKKETLRKSKVIEKDEIQMPESKVLTKMKSILDSVQKGYSHQAKNIGT